MEFDQKAREHLGAYVYGLFDPSASRLPFYIGKGRGNRVFDHARGDAEDNEDHAHTAQKLSRIRDIHASGRTVVHRILRFGLTDEEALKIEASLIDLVNCIAPDTLTNEISGQGVAEGIYDAEELARSLSAPPLVIINERVLLIKIERGWSTLLDKYSNVAAIPDREVFAATRGDWKLSVRRATQADCVLSVARGLVRGVYVPLGWEEAGYESRKRMTGAGDNSGFIHFKDKSVASLFSRGSQNPIRYVAC